MPPRHFISFWFAFQMSHKFLYRVFSHLHISYTTDGTFINYFIQHNILEARNPGVAPSRLLTILAAFLKVQTSAWKIDLRWIKISLSLLHQRFFGICVNFVCSALATLPLCHLPHSRGGFGTDRCQRHRCCGHLSIEPGVWLTAIVSMLDPAGGRSSRVLSIAYWCSDLPLNIFCSSQLFFFFFSSVRIATKNWIEGL